MKRTIGIVCLLACACILRAQAITSYSCDFESASENAQWERNTCSTYFDISECPNKWYIGAAGGFGLGSASASSSGLYVSSGVGADTLISSYANTKSVCVTASRTLQLAAGQYSVVFDWEARTSGSPDGIYVFWVEGANTNTWAAWDRSNVSLPPYVPASASRYGGVNTWRSSAFTFTTNGNGGKLVVLWHNTTAPVVEPAGKVDNILVYPGPLCPAPTNVQYNGNTGMISWRGNASSYDVMLFNYHTKSVSTFTDIQANSMQMPNISEEGYYYIYVRANCDEGHSVWAYTEKFIWIKGARCIDIFDLTSDNSGAAKCYWTDNSDYDSHLYDHAGQVLDPSGSDSENSRHVIHYKVGETDPRTENKLKTIPDGEIASIRVNGFWQSAGYHASTIEYAYPVQAGVSDLLELKFACVLENPSHDENEQPRFKLDVLQGSTVVSTCAQKDFKPGFGETSSWHKVAAGYSQIEWCDWQTVTVSLRDYIGSTLKIRLTAYDCTLSGHFGYAYFTMNCKGGDLQGIACGDFSTDHFEAPEGFRYRWYRADDPTKHVLSTNQDFHIESTDANIYLVDMIDKSNQQCFYTLEANPNPRFPQAKAHMTSVRGADCMNKVDFVQECSVVRINRATLDSILTDELVESVVWDFGDGSAPLATMDKNIHHDFPAEGGEFDVKITAGMSNGVCTDEYTLHLSLPDITTPDEHTYTDYCEEGVDYTDTVRVPTAVGCEQLKMHHYRYHPTYDTLYTDRFCEGGRYFFPGTGRYYTESIDTTVNLQSIYGCDSTIRLSLIVDPKLEVSYPDRITVCAEDRTLTIPYTVTSGSLDSVHVYFTDQAQQYGFEPVYAFGNDEEIVIPVPENARPDRYEVQLDFGSERCQMEIQTMRMSLTYPTSVVMQTGGFIGVQNEDYNGGYTFTDFAWYRDGVKVDVHDSYIPAGPEDVGATYVVYLTRPGEKEPLESCPIVYDPYAQGVDEIAGERSVWPTCVNGGASLHLAPQACTIYSILGSVVARYPAASETRTIAAPAQAGVYVVVFDNNQSSRILVR